MKNVTKKKDELKLEAKDKKLLDEYVLLKKEKDEFEKRLEGVKDSLVKLIDKHAGKIVYSGRNFTTHDKVKYEYSDIVNNISVEIKVLKEREETLQIAKIVSTTRYAKMYELKDALKKDKK